MHEILTITELEQRLNWRYAVSMFDPARPLSPEQLDAVAEILRLTPSSFGLQPWKFILITDPELRLRLREASWNQRQVTEASAYVVLTKLEAATEEHVDRYVDDMATKRGQTRESLQKYRDSMVKFVSRMTPERSAAWASDQVYIALGNLMTSCAVLGLDACPMEGFDKAKYDELLGLPELGYRSVVACAVGFRVPDDKYAQLAKIRFSTTEVVLRR